MLQLDLYRGPSGRHIALRVRDGGGVGWGPVENCETATGRTALPCMVARWLRLHSEPRSLHGPTISCCLLVALLPLLDPMSGCDIESCRLSLSFRALASREASLLGIPGVPWF